MNLKRRHLTESQRAMIGAKLANIRHGDNQYTKEDTQICASTSQPRAADIMDASIEGTSQTDAANPYVFSRYGEKHPKTEARTIANIN